MSTELAFVGDIHGNLRALRGLWDALDARHLSNVVFLGDYINKGPQSADVLGELISYAEAGRATLLAGNHEVALIDAIDRQDLSGFLKIGGAMTIRSYVGGKVSADALGHFLANLPATHLEALRSMPKVFESNDLIARHWPPGSSTSKFCVSAHVPIGCLPRIGRRSAQLDTGCGGGSGRLTALMWPDLNYLQVDSSGAIVTS